MRYVSQGGGGGGGGAAAGAETGNEMDSDVDGDDDNDGDDDDDEALDGGFTCATLFECCRQGQHTYKTSGGLSLMPPIFCGFPVFPF